MTLLHSPATPGGSGSTVALPPNARPSSRAASQPEMSGRPRAALCNQGAPGGAAALRCHMRLERPRLARTSPGT